ncbi:molybdopterin oxidoreductase family protein [Caminibacter mediatlanticus]|uniref:Molybdopterin oxidoreductase n=1 Tax=Caminibacter mediatlanticus TB-2 TaxID=391592 RepID=A0AAI9AHS8_9BACT|nr:molybdopterin-dependent oxidoreductase [Caminibacter mediatlanticus]EDM23877.1 Molybdopterin oxidoreductase [Caminibacter mediatlanticus TB-2]
MISVCTYCGVGCEIDVEVENNMIKKIKPLKNGISSGGELCIKGKYGYDFLDYRLKNHLVSYEFIKKNANDMPFSLQVRLANLIEYDERFYSAPFSLAVDLTAWKLKEIINKNSSNSIACIGGARTNIESAWFFQHFARKILKTPHIDNCARVCHSPSLSGLKMSIGEGASSVDFDSIFDAEIIFVIGSNTTEAHPMVASRIIKAKRKGAKLIVVDVREIPLMKFADISVILPFESNLLFLNAIAKELIQKDLIDKEFIKNRCVKFDEYKELILKDRYSKEFFKKLKGFEKISAQIEEIAKLITKKTIFTWGLGITEHIDGTESVNAISNLAMLTGNFKKGSGVLPLRGQNNVQGACDVGCLPYYLPDYIRPKEDEIGLMTPDVIDAILDNKIKAVINMGEDILHIHPNQNKIHKAFEKLEFLAVLEVMENEITKKADIVFGVKSGYEKEGVFVNAERRLHLTKPLIKSNLPDDWEVLQAIAKKFDENVNFNSSKEVFEECTKEVKRFAGATYERLEKKPLQWPIKEDGIDSPILHLEKFSTPDGKGHFHYYKYHLRGEVKDLIEGKKNWYLNTGRALPQYNNAAQTKKSEKLNTKYSDDVLLVNEIHKKEISSKVKLKSKYGESEILNVKFTNKVRPYTLFTTFHFAKNKINFLFGDEADHKVKTARFKSVKVEVINVN